MATIAKSIAKYEVPQKLDSKWPAISPLPNLKSIAPKMTEDYLPSYIRPWIKDITDRMQVPMSFVTIPAIVSLCSVVGRQLGIYPKKKDDWFVIPNMWGTVIARPGYFKTPAIAEALRPLDHLIKKAQVQFEAANVVSKTKADVVKATMDGIKENIKKAVRNGNNHEIESLQKELEQATHELLALGVTENRYKTNDATVEKIGALLLENSRGLLVVRDELSGWLKALQKAGREGDREFYLESWNGYGSYTVDRIGRGTLHIPALCLSIFGGLQPGKLESYIAQALGGKEGDDGLLQRFQLMVYPEINKKWRNIDRKPDTNAFRQVVHFFERLSNIDPKEIGAEKQELQSIPGLHFDREAQDAFNQWREKLEIRLRNDEMNSPALESHLSKYRSMVPSLALVFHLSSDQYRKGSVGIKALNLAIKWASYLESHAKKVYSSVIHSEFKAAEALAEKIRAGKVKDGDTVRTIYRKCWAGLESSKLVDQALGVLEDHGWLRVVQTQITYRTKDEIKLNPGLKF